MADEQRHRLHRDPAATVASRFVRGCRWAVAGYGLLFFIGGLAFLGASRPQPVSPAKTAALPAAAHRIADAQGRINWASVWSGGRVRASGWDYFRSHHPLYVIESGASHHGVSPWYTYLTVWLGQRTNIGGVLLLLLALTRLRKSWLLLAAAFLPVAALSAIGHKEERFLLSSYPLILIAGTVGWAEWISRRNLWPARALPVGIVSATLALLVLGSGFWGLHSQDWRWRAGVFAGQAWVGRQDDARGILLDDRLHLNGGYLLLNRHIPQLSFTPRLARHRLYNYLVLKTDSPPSRAATRLGFLPVAVFEGVTVFRRTGARGNVSQSAPH